VSSRSNLYLRWAAAVLLLLVLIALSPAFGATWDERALQAYGEQIWDYYLGHRALADIDVGFGYTRIYGGLVEFLSSAAQHLVPANQYVVRHAVNAVFGWTGVVFAFLMAFRLFGTRAAWLAALMLVSMPRYIAESMNNTKDLPFAVLMLAGLYYILTIKPEYPFISWSHTFKIAATVALALNVRSMGLVLFGYAAIGLAIAVIASGERSGKRLAATTGRFAVIVVAGLLGGAVFWPWAQASPLVRPIQAFFLASSFSWGNPSLFAGQDLPANELPWYYLPTWLGMTLPPIVIVGAGLSLARFWSPGKSRLRLAAIWAFVLVPAVYAVARGLTLYDGIRHLFFIVPPIAVLAAAGWDVALAFSPSRLAWATSAVLVFGCAEPLAFQVRNHPNQTVYFSPLMGGPRAAFGRYEMDYWGNCVLEAVRWSATQAEQAKMPVVITANAWEIAVADASRYQSLAFRLRQRGGYHLDIRLLKGSRDDVIYTAELPDILYRVKTADGTPLCVVLPGPEYPQLAARLAQTTSARRSQ
jgi:Dolichyl-phosphate-mannose-protein mannosyltransferase